VSARAGAWVGWGVAVAAVGAIAFVRPAAAERFHRLRTTADVYPLPPPEQTVVASLGFRAALADALFAHVLVSYGLHFQEKRRFEFVGDYLDAMNALDPTFRDPYRFADTFLTMQPEPPRLEQYVKAREIVLRGTANRPYDTELWLSAGQYLAYLAPPYLPTEQMRREWKIEGARLLSRACELASKNQNVPYHCISAAALLENVGEREAAIESLTRLLAVTDDPEIEKMALGYLQRKLSERQSDKEKRRRDAFRAAWKGDLPFISKDLMLLIGPRVDTSACAGPTHPGGGACASTWRDWALRVDPTPGG
jgi:tetratricopeptide (TPR) repeat protein